MLKVQQVSDKAFQPRCCLLPISGWNLSLISRSILFCILRSLYSVSRSLGRCIPKEIGGEVGELLAPIQMGCGVSGGSEIAARMSQVFLDAHSCHVLIKTDFKNAFNLTPRRLILEGLQAFCPRLIPWFRWSYGEPSPLVDSQGHTVGSSQRGCRQGVPLAALLFCVDIQGALKEVSDLLQHASDEATQGMNPIPMTQLQHPCASLKSNRTWKDWISYVRFLRLRGLTCHL
jgi:hypothetical protein